MSRTVELVNAPRFAIWQPPAPYEVPMDEPAAVMRYPVKISYYFDDRLMGMDKGFMSFVDGCMFFLGSETTFSLYTTFVTSSSKTYGVNWEVDSVKGLMLIDAPPKMPGLDFNHAYTGWQREQPRMGIVPIMPPITDQPGLRRKLFQNKADRFVHFAGLWIWVFPVFSTLYAMNNPVPTILFIIGCIALSAALLLSRPKKVRRGAAHRRTP